MVVAFQKSLLEQIAVSSVTEDASWSQDQKDENAKKQAKIQMLILGSLTTRLAQQLMDQETGTDMWAELCKIYEGKNNDATKAQKVYRLQGELHRTHLRANGDVRGHLYGMFRIRNELAELGSSLSDLRMVDMLLRSLPSQVCYNELRRKVLFSSNMSKYTPALVRELILTAETRSKDWEKSAFGNNQGKKKQGKASSGLKSSQNKTTGDANKKRTAKADVECFNCGVTADATAEDIRMNKRDVVLGEVVKRVAKDYDSSCWYFDSGTNAHIVTSKEYFTVLNNMEDSDWNPTMSGFADGVDAQAEGFGTILLATMIDEEMIFAFVKDVLYVPKAGCNLFSPGQALEQGFKMSWDQTTLLFGMSKDSTERSSHQEAYSC
ncbi:gag-polypeptide of LTR copia-type [Phytophthora infestans]|uniref:Gag-polypeptide of LTR copia-type n=1 Tax=Phytophthora infestans TaxID=4787 RepID=A0A8S9UNN4_PHYIN|nr:gag-polypeptide of LTR copia-type [Phytophthora infestans]